MIAVWFSNGAASAVALKLAVDRFGTTEVRAINNPVREEDDDNLRFQRDVSDWLGIEIERAVNPRFPDGSATTVWAVRRGMSFPNGAPCTVHLKKEARQHWEAIHKPDWHVLGFTADEEARHNRFVLTERDNVLPLLIDAEMTKTDCAELLIQHGIKLPRLYAEGYPNANCIGCVKATSPTYWNLVRRTRPEVFRQRAEQSRELGVRLVRYKGARIFLDELPEHATGQRLQSLRMPDCGTFCEEQNYDR